MSIKTCLICGEGILTDRVDANYIENISSSVPIFYSECDSCGSEQTDVWQAILNKVVYKQLLEREKWYENKSDENS